MACCFGRRAHTGRNHPLSSAHVVSSPANPETATTSAVTGHSTTTTIAVAEASAALPEHILPGCDPVRLLGEGTFGTVVLVRERATGALFAAKVMSKAQLIEEDQYDNIITERRVLREAGPHPFIIFCYSGFQTDDAVVLVLEYLPGGDMYDLLRKYGCLQEDQARFYIAEILVGLQELHRHNFVFRDLKLENILIDAHGHIRLTDFGLSGQVKTNAWDDHTITDISGTAIYQAPEILAQIGHGRLVDYWALGVLTHVILTGRPPFIDEDRVELYNQIQTRDLDLDSNPQLSHVSQDARDFIKALLQRDSSKRLGGNNPESTKHTSIREHPFFRGIDWDALLKFDVRPPLPPPLEPLELPPSEYPAEGIVGTGASQVNGGDKTKQLEAADAEKRVRDKLAGKGAAKRRPRKTRSLRERRRLDSTEYKVVNVAPSALAGRVSIGLDFQHKNKNADKKTWTNAGNDYGRVLSSHNLSR